jgi:hypothetical protein
MKIIINADDFGLTNGVTYGIYDAIKNGVVSSTTLMVNQEASLLAGRIARQDENLNVGLHLNISKGFPLSNCPSLVDENNNFIKPKDLLNDDEYLEEEIYQEFLKQYERFFEIVGRKPTHLDSHLYSHQIFPKVQRQAIKFAEEFRLPVRACQTKYYQKIELIDEFKVIGEMSIYDLFSKFMDLINLNLKQDYLELMVHPGFVDLELLNISSYNLPRVLEAKVLKLKEVKKYLELNNVEIISFREVSGGMQWLTSN